MNVSVEELKNLTDKHRIVYRCRNSPGFVETGLYYDRSGDLVTYTGDYVLFSNGEVDSLFGGTLFEVREIISPKPELVTYEGMLLSVTGTGYPYAIYRRGSWTRIGGGGILNRYKLKLDFQAGEVVEFIPEPFTKKENQND